VVKPVSDHGFHAEQPRQAVRRRLPIKARRQNVRASPLGGRPGFIKSSFEVAMSKKNNSQRFNNFVQWLSGRLNLPADTVENTVRAIPADERRGITTVRQWRPLIEKYR